MRKGFFITILVLLVVAILVVAALLFRPWALISLPGSGQPANLDEIPEDDLPPRTALVTLPGDPTTGYDWMFTIVPEDVLLLTDSGFTPFTDPETGEATGNAGTYHWLFHAGAAGDVDVEFLYATSFEDEAPNQIVTYTFSVSPEGELSLLSAAGTVENMSLPIIE